MIILNVRIPSKQIVISESHSNIDSAMDRGDLLAKSLGGTWTLTFNKKVKIQ